MKVRLTRKHADRIDGIDLREHQPGDLLDLPTGDARVLIAEEWATREPHLADTPRRLQDVARKLPS